MAEEKKQVTIRFESTMDSANSEPLLLSGPIQIFGSVDTFAELTSKRTNNPDDPTLMDAIFAATDVPQIVMFVNDIVDVNNDSQHHRGAYFLFVGDRKGISCEAGIDWQEILLGTHSHENKEQLDSLSDLVHVELNSEGKPVIADDRIVAVDSNGNFKLIEKTEGKYLPEFPEEIQARIKELEMYKDLNEPEENEWHHLDADLDLLNDTYDWLEKDKDGNYKNLAVGNCRDLYRSLIKADKKLFIDSDYKLSTDDGLSHVALEVYNVNFDSTKTLDNCENILKDNTNSSRLLLTLKFPCVIDETDDIFIFNNEKPLTNADYEIILRDTHSITFGFNKYRVVPEQSIVHVLISRGTANRFEVLNAFETGKLSIDEINKSLVELFVEGEFNRRPNLPHLYLTTDENGNIHWDNKLLPAQYFYAKTKLVNKNDADENGTVEVVFENVNFNTADGDFPILLADEVFAFNIQPTEVGKDVKYLINTNEHDRYFAEETSTQFTLIVIKNSANNSIADLIADKYVSKEDAIKFITNGRVNLKGYVKKSQLKGFSLAGHTHSEYAKKNHNHDNRYANYSHSHPELAGIIAKASRATPAQVQEWINNLTYDLRDRVDAILKEKFQIDVNGDIDITASNKAENIIVSKDIVDLINYKIETEEYPIEKLNMNDEGTYYLDKVLEYLTRFFELDMVPSDQVFLGFDLPVKNKIGGITKEKYYSNDYVGDILRDMLNPYTDVIDAKEVLTPSAEFTFLKWFIKDEFDQYIEIDVNNIKQKEEGQLFFKPYLRNNKNEVCEFKYTSSLTGDGVLVTKELINNYAKDAAGYYLYDSAFNFTESESNYPEIEISWENITIYDSYGISTSELNPDNSSFIIKPDFNIILPMYFTGTLENVDYIYSSLFDNFANHIENETVKFNIQENKIISILMDSSVEYFDIIESTSGINIKNVFVEEDSSVIIFNKSYTLYYYEILDDNVNNISLKIKIGG